MPVDGWISMGEGRELPPQGECKVSPDGKHHYVSTSCIQSTERFECPYCGDWWYD